MGRLLALLHTTLGGRAVTHVLYAARLHLPAGAEDQADYGERLWAAARQAAEEQWAALQEQTAAEVEGSAAEVGSRSTAWPQCCAGSVGDARGTRSRNWNLRVNPVSAFSPRPALSPPTQAHTLPAPPNAPPLPPPPHTHHTLPAPPDPPSPSPPTLQAIALAEAPGHCASPEVSALLDAAAELAGSTGLAGPARAGVLVFNGAVSTNDGGGGWQGVTLGAVQAALQQVQEDVYMQRLADDSTDLHEGGWGCCCFWFLFLGGTKGAWAGGGCG
jgi:hypothetical protein